MKNFISTTASYIKSSSDSSPPFCPRPECRWHCPVLARAEAKFFRHGVLKSKRAPSGNGRWRCTRCRRVFTDSYFTLYYRDRKKKNYETIFHLRLGGVSKRRIAQLNNCSTSTVCFSLSKLSRWALAKMSFDLHTLKINESLAYDGIENFSFSQFEINYLNQAVGRSSFFVYDFNFSPLNRKGRLSEKQKTYLKFAELKFGRFPKKSIEIQSRKVFNRLAAKIEHKVDLYTDHHQAYVRALGLEALKKLEHIKISSKRYRNFRNPLFAINHSELLARHQLSDFKRETIAFAKHSVAMMESFVLLVFEKNYLRTVFQKKHKYCPIRGHASPAMIVGVESRILAFKEAFSKKISKAQARLNDDWAKIFERVDCYSRRKIRSYLGD